MRKKLGFLIMRAQPLHIGHMILISKAKEQCDDLIIILGSANSPRTIKNPFTYKEREEIILSYVNEEIPDNQHVFVYPCNDYRYSDSQWISDISSIVDENNKRGSEVIMFGHEKEGNFYLKWFPQFKFVNIESGIDISATKVRENLFNTEQTDIFEQSVIDDYKYFQQEKETFSTYPYKETLNFNCADAIVECSGHILLIQRGRAPGAGTWALPGGFKNNDETYIECAIRELEEETNIRVPKKVIIGSIVNTKLFDSPTRGCGIPRISLCVHIKIEPNHDNTLPRANGSDDATKATWFPIQTIMNDMQLFDDHLDIISTMCGVLPIPAHKNSKYRFQA